MTLEKHSCKLNGHATSITIERPFWDIVEHIADENGQSITSLLEEIDGARDGNLSSAIRLYVLDYVIGKGTMGSV